MEGTEHKIFSEDPWQGSIMVKTTHKKGQPFNGLAFVIWWRWADSNRRPESFHLELYMLIWSINLTRLLPGHQGSQRASLYCLGSAIQTYNTGRFRISRYKLGATNNWPSLH